MRAFLRANWFQIAVVVLLVLIYSEVKRDYGRNTVGDTVRNLWREVQNSGRREEAAPNPPGSRGLGNMYPDETAAALQQELKLQREQLGASAPMPDHPKIGR